MTKFKDILSKRLESEVGYPSGHLDTFGQNGVQMAVSHSWAKDPVFAETDLQNASKGHHSSHSLYSTSVDEDEERDEPGDNSGSPSPIMDLTTTITGGGQPGNERERSPRDSGYGDTEEAKTVNQMLGYSDNDHNRLTNNKLPLINTNHNYRQPWDIGGQHLQNIPPMVGMGHSNGMPTESQLSSPTSSAFTSNSDSTPSTLVLANLKKRKRKPMPIPEDCKDGAYWERRKRNNESAKRSREMRRIKEQQTTMRVIYLEQENLRLKTESNMFKEELEKLREWAYKRNAFPQNGVQDLN
ncbi:Cell death specification protein 2 [Halotydeus destructor]|nr:Cell death specification protein 2 [Halotydeus destructor]